MIFSTINTSPKSFMKIYERKSDWVRFLLGLDSGQHTKTSDLVNHVSWEVVVWSDDG